MSQSASFCTSDCISHLLWQDASNEYVYGFSNEQAAVLAFLFECGAFSRRKHVSNKPFLLQNCRLIALFLLFSDILKINDTRICDNTSSWLVWLVQIYSRLCSEGAGMNILSIFVHYSLYYEESMLYCILIVYQ